ncbi:MAG: accessory gene regulator B family protein [Clostridium sp.]|uniref:accessory gene regulator ArgB-like protein n=1 Tax=Clostridium sp. TaxID=1506 RepID=UPI0025BDF815|nr:accessory gene regulator B family protein [Clostridium sp.]MCE5220168.1 accessory gene regulator B family protein [Clostridium sp.]
MKKYFRYLYTLKYIKLFSYWSARSLQLSRKENHQHKYMYYYGFEILYGAINKGLLLLLAGLILDILPQILVTTLSFMLLRIFIGGLHFNNYTKCAWISLVTLVGMGLLGKYIPYNNLMNIIVFISLFFIILRYAPIPHPNRPLKDGDKGKFKCIAFCLLIAIYCVELLKGNPDINNSIMYGVLLAGIIALPIFKNVE